MSDLTSEQPIPAVEIRIAATPLHISAVRAVVADLAMREDFDLDAIADIKLAVDEVCSTLVRLAAPNALLRCQFEHPSPGKLLVRASVLAKQEQLPKQDSFGWQVLTALTDSAHSSAEPTQDGQYLIHIELEKRSTTAVLG